MIKRKGGKAKPRRTIGTIVLTVATFLAFMGIVWQAYQSTVDTDASEEALPIIKADARPFKVKPEEEGGMLFSHRGMSIFETIEEPFAGEERQEDRKTERLVFSQEKLFPTSQDREFMENMTRYNTVAENYRVVPTPTRETTAQTDQTEVSLPNISTSAGEEELTRQEFEPVRQLNSNEPVSNTPVSEPMLLKDQKMAPVVNTETQSETVKDTQKENIKLSIQNIIEENADKAGNSVEKPVLNLTNEPVSTSKAPIERRTYTQPVTREVKPSVTVSEPKRVEPKKVSQPAVQKKVQTKPRATASYAPGNYLIQFGSVRSEAAARQGWKNLQTKLPRLLSPLNLNVQRADLGSRGVFYRIQTSKLSKADANSVCSQVKASKVSDCLVKIAK